MRSLKTMTLPDGRSGVQVTLPFDPAMLLEEAFEAVATDIGLTVMEGLLEDEAESLAGRKHARRDGYTAYRHGYEEGSVVFAGKRLAITRPRLRGATGEVPLQRYRLFKADRKLQRSVKAKVLAKVSTRRYESVVDDLAEGFGIRKSSVSRHWRSVSAKELEGLLTRPLGNLDLVAVLIDGVHFQDQTLVVALGIAGDGRKHLLGLWEGDSENTATVTGLLTNLRERGLETDVTRLFILDGGKALSAGVAKVFGRHALIQRCHVHKKRNVLDQLPKSHHWRISHQLSAAWGMNDLNEARAAIDQLLRELDRLSAPAAASLREGLDETLTLHRLGIPPEIRSRLNTTNAIENIFSVLRDQVRRVRNWRSGPDMRQRWAAAILIDAEQRFNRIKGYAHLAQVANLLARVHGKTQTA
jgi:transposase-like protein